MKKWINIEQCVSALKKASVNSYAFCKSMFLRFRQGSLHYGLRALLALVISVYLIYLLKCFLTIPVKDNYINIITYSPDSIVPMVDYTIGKKDILTTYANTNSIESDDCCLKFKIYEQKNAKLYFTFTRYYNDKSQMGIIIDSVYNKYTQDSIYKGSDESTYAELFYNKFHSEQASLSSWCYVHLYNCVLSSLPLGAYNKDINKYKQAYINQYNGLSKCLYYENIESGAMVTSYLATIDTIVIPNASYKKNLSPNHGYVSNGQIFLFKAQSNQNKIDDTIIDAMTLTANVSGSSIYEKFPILIKLLQKEDISQSYYRFYVTAPTVDSYIINLHSRGGAIVNNNPSDELQVLSLHDTQIIKRRKSQLSNLKDFEETDLLLSFPENSNIQYIRLFIITLLIGWLIKSCGQNLRKLISRNRKDNN